MGNVLIHKARELRPRTRAALEAELGRCLQDNEEVSIMAFEPHETPAGDARGGAARGLEEYFDRIDQKSKDIPDQEMQDALNEAVRSVRPGYCERK